MAELRVGQVWADNDPRAAGRTIEITELHDADADHSEPYVRVRVTKVGRNVRRKEVGEQRTIKQRRFKPTRNGYRLVSDVPADPTRAPYPVEEASLTNGREHVYGPATRTSHTEHVDASAVNWGGTDMSRKDNGSGDWKGGPIG